MRSRNVLAVLGIAIVAAAPAYAQGAAAPQQDPAPSVAPLLPEPEGLSLTPFVDIGFAGDYENTPAGFGVALGYGATNRIALEADLSFTPDGDLLADVDSSVWSLSGNLLYHFLAEDFTPYLAIGLGVLGSHTDAEDLGLVDDDTSYALAWNWGGGIKTALSERFGLRGDLRYFFGDDLAPDHWRLFGGVVIRRIGRP